MFQLFGSLLPRSIQKRPTRLRLEFTIDWHSKCDRLYLNIATVSWGWLLILVFGNALDGAQTWTGSHKHNFTRQNNWGGLQAPNDMCSLLLPRKASQHGIVGGEAEHDVVLTPGRLRLHISESKKEREKERKKERKNERKKERKSLSFTRKPWCLQWARWWHLVAIGSLPPAALRYELLHPSGNLHWFQVGRWTRLNFSTSWFRSSVPDLEISH